MMDCAPNHVYVGCVVLLAAQFLGNADADAADDEPIAISAEDLDRWGRPQIVFTGKLDRVDAGPVGRSLPPVYTHTLHFTIQQVLRGDLTAGQQTTCSHVARQMNAPEFPEGKVCLVAADHSRGRLRALHVQGVTDDELARAKLACLIPLGWNIEQGRLISPWASLGERAWPADRRADAPLACANSGRPILPTGAAVQFEVTPVPPKKAIKWTNPDGDGEYKITVTNPTDKPLTVPALLSDGDDILWKESLVILCQDQAYTVPGAKGVSRPVKGTVLKPGQSVSTVVNALQLEGPEWPRGGYRIEFQFCLGDKSNVQSFYYMSRHHDKIREQLRRDGA